MKNLLKKMLPLAGGMALLFSSCKQEYLTPKPATDASALRTDAMAVAAAATYSLNNWMGSVSDQVSLTRLTIPGTHDSGARFESISGTAKCQNLTIGEQLNAGVRFLDIRCRHYNNAFTIHHGAVYQNINFDDVLNACWAFLQSNPSETIIMSVKEEHTASGNNRTFEATFDSYVQKNASKWYLGAGVPTLSAVRGKIVLYRRFGATNTPKGIDAVNYQDNTTFEINTAAASLKVQDQYKVSNNNTKWTAITNLFTEARTGDQNRLFVNYTSGYYPGIFGIPNIPTVSNNINPRVTDYFNTAPTGRYGIVAMDFAEATRNNLLIRTNFAAQ